MAKRIYSFWNLLLGSLIALLGFGACKTTRKAQDTTKLYGPPPTNITDPAIVLYGAPPAKIIEKKDSVKEMKLLYGAPPVRIEKKSE